MLLRGRHGNRLGQYLEMPDAIRGISGFPGSHSFSRPDGRGHMGHANGRRNGRIHRQHHDPFEPDIRQGHGVSPAIRRALREMGYQIGHRYPYSGVGDPVWHLLFGGRNRLSLHARIPLSPPRHAASDRFQIRLVYASLGIYLRMEFICSEPELPCVRDP